jgi:hypothetical protein
MLQFSLKWQKKYKNQPYQASTHQLELTQLITNAFQKLGYPEPEKEVLFLIMLLDGLSSQLMRQPSDEFIQTILAFIKSKYR